MVCSINFLILKIQLINNKWIIYSKSYLIILLFSTCINLNEPRFETRNILREQNNAFIISYVLKNAAMLGWHKIFIQWFLNCLKAKSGEKISLDLNAFVGRKSFVCNYIGEKFTIKSNYEVKIKHRMIHQLSLNTK